MKSSFNIIKKERVSSTNDFAKKLARTENISDFTVVFAYEQLIGKGQKHNSWHSEAGKNLTFSIITYPGFIKAQDQFYLSKIISLGIVEYLNKQKKGFKIKWPNDIYYQDKKICGILIENTISGSQIKNSVIGIGLNMNQSVFPDYLPDAVSLSMITDEFYILEEELQTLLSFLFKKYKSLEKLSFKEIDKMYHKDLYRINQMSDYKDSNGKFKGKINGTLPEGKLIIQTENNEIRMYNFKEVEFL